MTPYFLARLEFVSPTMKLCWIGPHPLFSTPTSCRGSRQEATQFQSAANVLEAWENLLAKSGKETPFSHGVTMHVECWTSRDLSGSGFKHPAKWPKSKFEVNKEDR